MSDPFAASIDPDIPTPTRDDLLRLVHAENRDQLAAGTLPAKVAETLWADARRQWDEGHKAEATRKANEAGPNITDKPTGDEKAVPGARASPRATGIQQRTNTQLLAFMSPQVRAAYDAADGEQKQIIWEANERAFEKAEKRKEQRRVREQQRMADALDMYQRVKEDPDKTDLLPPENASMPELLKWHEEMSKPAPHIPSYGSLLPTITRVFLAHASEDKLPVREIHSKLEAHGFKPWLDEIDLLAGQNWQVEIQKAIRESDIFVACLSRLSVSKQGYVQREFRTALSVYAEKPPGSIYLIPLKLDKCEVPDFQLPQLGISLRDIQWLDYWLPNGFDRLVKSIEAATGRSSSPRLELPYQPSSTAPSKIDLTGQWQGTDGLKYSIQQAGDSLTFEGFHSMHGKASVGEGRIVGEEVDVSYRTIYGAEGDGTLEISPNRRRLSGQVTDHNTGSVLTLMLTR